MTPPILFKRGVSDPDGDWALTRTPLVVEALLAGKALLVFSSIRPDPRLIGKRLWLHGGSSLPKITPLKENEGAQRLICDLAYRGGPAIPQENWRTALDDIQARGAGRVRGSAMLAGAFVAGGLAPMSEGRAIVKVFKPDSHSHFYLGDFMAFSAERQVPIGNFEAPVWNERSGKFEGARWVWCFCAPERGDPLTGQVLQGFGGMKERGQCGVWNLRLGAAFRREEKQRLRLGSCAAQRASAEPASTASPKASARLEKSASDLKKERAA